MSGYGKPRWSVKEQAGLLKDVNRYTLKESGNSRCVDIFFPSVFREKNCRHSKSIQAWESIASMELVKC